MSRALHLVILASTPAAPRPTGEVIISRKFVEGVVAYARNWHGPITVLMEDHLHWDGMLDPMQVSLMDLPFDLKIVSFPSATTLALVSQASLVLAPLGDRQIPLHRASRGDETRWVYYSEQSVRTRKQMVSVTTANPLLRLRRQLWEQTHEREFRRAVTQADGLQCNGTPTYRDYAPI